MNDVAAGGKKKRKLSFWLKLLAGCVLLPPALVFVAYVLFVYGNRALPDGFSRKDFRVVTQRVMAVPLGFYEGDLTFTRLHSTLPPKLAMKSFQEVLLERDQDVSEPVLSTRATRRSLDSKIAKLKWPGVSPPPKELGWEMSYRFGGTGYGHIYIWDDGNGGSWLDIVRGAKL